MVVSRQVWSESFAVAVRSRHMPSGLLRHYWKHFKKKYSINDSLRARYCTAAATADRVPATYCLGATTLW